MTDLQTTITALFQELLPTLSADRFEMDRIHRTLAPKKAEGPPHDIITKFHFYRTKENLLAAARERNDLSFQGEKYQLFADLSQLTINKRRAMKPLFLILQNHHINYNGVSPFLYVLHAKAQNSSADQRKNYSKLYKICIYWIPFLTPVPHAEDQRPLLLKNPPNFLETTESIPTLTREAIWIPLHNKL